ncbi:MAG: hypothetical protein AAGM38_09425, partial [Pseudomonadota bacterium]
LKNDLARQAVQDAGPTLDAPVFPPPAPPSAPTAPIRAAQAQEPPRLEPHAFGIGGERFAIDLPADAQIAEDPGGAYVWIEVAPSDEAAPTLWLEAPYDENQPFALNAAAEFSAGARLEYRTSLAIDGVGEREAHLDGRLTLGPRVWSVSCVLRPEMARADDAEWCLPYLRSIAPAS